MFRIRELPSTVPAAVLAVFVVLGQAIPALAQRTPPVRNSPAVTAAFKNVVAKPSESTVRVMSDDQDAALGAIVSTDGYIITKASELRGKLVVKLKDGRTFPAKFVGVDERHDLGLLKISAIGLKPVEWRASKEAEPGHWVAAPSNGAMPVAIGVISVAVRKPHMLEMPRTAPKSNSGYLGVVLEPGDEGAPTIGRITSDSPAARAGLKVGDIVLVVAGRTVRTTERMIATIQGLRPGQSVSITVKRGEDEKEVSAKLDRFPLNLLSRGERMNMMGSELSYRLGGFPVILQHDLLIKPHDCGGPLVDLEGKTVGINIARAGRTESYAIPSDDVQALLPSLKSGKLAPIDDTEDKQVTLLRGMIKELRTDLTKAERKLADLGDDTSTVAKKSAVDQVAELRKKLEKTQDELAKMRSKK